MPQVRHSCFERLCWAFAGRADAAHSWKRVLVLLLVAVTYLALTPKPLEGIDSGWDKLAHAAAFTALAFCAHLSYPVSRRTRTVLLCGLLAYGGLIELLQLFVPGRSAEWGDLLADSLGTAFGAVVAGTVLYGATKLPVRAAD